jgi:predicted nucleotidyltransferase
MNPANHEMLVRVARAFDELLDRIVFVGGVTVDLYVSLPGAPDARPTIDVDCIVEIGSLLDYYAFEEMLRSKGFRHDQRDSAPICRWRWEDITIDVMPTNPDILGFSNEYYKEGLQHGVEVELETALSIRILEVPYFLSSKFVALENRGMRDLRTSADLEDIVHILRNRETVRADILNADQSVRKYLQGAFRELLLLDVIDEAIASVLDRGEAPGTAAKVKALMESLQ